MVTVALQLPTLPMVIILPRFLTDGFSLLGVGDIVLPGIWLCYLYRFDHLNNKTTFVRGYFFCGWIAYMLGLVTTFLMVFALQRGQPALLYLVPYTIIPTAILAYCRGELSLLWRGMVLDTNSVEEGVNQKKEDEVGLLETTKTM